jgi:predicted AlkP superfamily pyrophosphatase or phosphodiesterase
MSSKDRGAILPVGHTANAAYWYDGGDHGKFISSTYYLEKLPKWVLDFNNSGKAENYISKPWDTYYNISTYTESIEDNNPYEQVLNGEKTPTFPHNIPELREKNDNYSIITETPFGNSLLTDLAIASINGEQLGKSSFTDFLSISYSSTDYIGHGFGVVSKEIQDAYIRLDKDLERLLNFLDSDVGKENYTLFLTADHGATHVPQYLIDNSIPANYFDGNKFKAYVKEVVINKFGTESLIENISNNTIYFDKTELNKLKIDQGIIQQIIADEIINYDGIYKTVTARTLQTTNFTEGILSLIQNSYNQKLSGDVLYAHELSTISNWYENKGGTTHGSGYNYNTHVPLLFYGKGIKNGASNSYYHIIDIAPTISTLLGIEFPNGNTGKVIEEVLK